MLTNPILYIFAQPQHSNEAAIKTNRTVAIVLHYHLGCELRFYLSVDCHGNGPIVLEKRLEKKLTPLTLYVKL
jgi:hypothetical protein